jgi:hypothetical protein
MTTEIFRDIKVLRAMRQEEHHDEGTCNECGFKCWHNFH